MKSSKFGIQHSLLQSIFKKTKNKNKNRKKQRPGSMKVSSTQKEEDKCDVFSGRVFFPFYKKENLPEVLQRPDCSPQE